jgi:hypothetical protein
MDHKSELLELPNKVKEVIAACTLKPYETCVRATSNTATDAYTITLPPAAECVGRFFSISATIANSKNITVAHHSDSAGWSNAVLTVTNDRVLYYCDGFFWYLIFDLTT